MHHYAYLCLHYLDIASNFHTIYLQIAYLCPYLLVLPSDSCRGLFLWSCIKGGLERQRPRPTGIRIRCMNIDSSTPNFVDSNDISCIVSNSTLDSRKRGRTFFHLPKKMEMKMGRGRGMEPHDMIVSFSIRLNE